MRTFLTLALAACTATGDLPRVANEVREPTPRDAPQLAPGQGWTEAVIHASENGATEAFIGSVAGWQGRRNSLTMIGTPRGSPDVCCPAYFAPFEMLTYAATPAPGAARIVSASSNTAALSRPATFAPYDTGGIFSLMTRTGDVDALVARARAAGYEPYSEPYDLSFGDLQLRNVVIRGPDGLNLAAYEWVSPKRDDVDDESVTAAFNSMQMVADLGAARAFYVDGLGMEVITEGTFVDPRPLDETNFQVPWDTPRHYVILKAAGSSGDSGRIELMRFEGVEGRAAPAWSPDALGIVELRWPVADLDAKLDELRARGIEPVLGPAPIALPPYGTGRAFTVVSPEQAGITFFELEE